MAHLNPTEQPFRIFAQPPLCLGIARSFARFSAWHRSSMWDFSVHAHRFASKPRSMPTDSRKPRRTPMKLTSALFAAALSLSLAAPAFADDTAAAPAATDAPKAPKAKKAKKADAPAAEATPAAAPA